MATIEMYANTRRGNIIIITIGDSRMLWHPQWNHFGRISRLRIGIWNKIPKFSIEVLGGMFSIKWTTLNTTTKNLISRGKLKPFDIVRCACPVSTWQFIKLTKTGRKFNWIFRYQTNAYFLFVSPLIQLQRFVLWNAPSGKRENFSAVAFVQFFPIEFNQWTSFPGYKMKCAWKLANCMSVCDMRP